MAEYRNVKNIFARALVEFSGEAIETVIDLFARNEISRSAEWQRELAQFRNLHSTYHSLPESERDNYCWQTSVAVGGQIGKIRNASIGVLLVNSTNGA